MAQYVVPPINDFDHRQALIDLLRLLEDLFKELWEDRERLLPASAIEALPPALDHAIGQIRSLIEVISGPAFDRRERGQLEDFGLVGAPLRFKLVMVAQANDRNTATRNRALEGVTDGRTRGRWRVYRRALKATLAAIDGPLESLTKLLGAKEGVVEFKKAIEVGLDLAS